jgi:hypothetical protein
VKDVWIFKLIFVAGQNFAIGAMKMMKKNAMMSFAMVNCAHFVKSVMIIREVEW